MQTILYEVSMGMNGYPWRRAGVLALLGLGIFFTFAGLMGLFAWLLTGTWHPFLTEIGLIAALIAMPVAYLMWTQFQKRNS